METKREGVCALEGCDNVMGPDAVEIFHKGKSVGGICEVCLSSIPAFRVLFVKEKDGYVRLEEMVPINSLAK